MLTLDPIPLGWKPDGSLVILGIDWYGPGNLASKASKASLGYLHQNNVETYRCLHLIDFIWSDQSGLSGGMNDSYITITPKNEGARLWLMINSPT